MICNQQLLIVQVPIERRENAQTFEKRLFSIFLAIDSFSESGSFRSRIDLCLICTTSEIQYFGMIQGNNSDFDSTTDLLSFIFYHKLESLPFSNSEHCFDIQSEER